MVDAHYPARNHGCLMGCIVTVAVSILAWVALFKLTLWLLG